MRAAILFCCQSPLRQEDDVDTVITVFSALAPKQGPTHYWEGTIFNL